MSTTYIVGQIQLTTICCGSCGGVYAILERHRELCQQEGRSWNCPYCRVGWGYKTIGENERLKRELEQEKQRRLADVSYWSKRADNSLKEAEHFRKSRDGMKGQLVKVKRRVGKGACPCCNRFFADLHRHMVAKHPTFTEPPTDGGKIIEQ